MQCIGQVLSAEPLPQLATVKVPAVNILVQDLEGNH